MPKVRAYSSVILSILKLRAMRAVRTVFCLGQYPKTPKPLPLFFVVWFEINENE